MHVEFESKIVRYYKHYEVQFIRKKPTLWQRIWGYRWSRGPFDTLQEARDAEADEFARAKFVPYIVSE
jgi:hypothetical protein